MNSLTPKCDELQFLLTAIRNEALHSEQPCPESLSFNIQKSFFMSVENKIQTLTSKFILGSCNIDYHKRMFYHNQVKHREMLSRFFYNNAIEICRCLSESGVSSVVRKGPAYDWEIFNSLGSRDYFDIDILIESENVRGVEDCMLALGFQSGRALPGTNKIVPHPRELLIEHSLYPDHLPSFIKRVEEAPIDYLVVDFATDISWHGFESSASIKTILDQEVRKPMSQHGLPMLPLHLNFVDCALHAFRETYFNHGNWLNSGALLKNFADFAALSVKMSAHDIAKARQAFEGIPIRGPIEWLIYHTDQLLGTKLATKFERAFSGPPIETNTFQDKRGVVKRWSGDMFARLASPSPRDYMLANAAP